MNRTNINQAMNPSERKAYQKLSYVDRATRYLENTGSTWSSFKVPALRRRGARSRHGGAREREAHRST